MMPNDAGDDDGLLEELGGLEDSEEEAPIDITAALEEEEEPEVQKEAPKRHFNEGFKA